MGEFAARFQILAVGRKPSPPLAALIEEYQTRIQRFCPLRISAVAEENHPAPGEAGVAIAREGARLLEQLPARGVIVPLAVTGQAYGSEEFATRLKGWRDQGDSTITFVIGGPSGLAPGVLERATTLLSLGPPTYPHMLARVLLLEQIYRALTIIGRVPYHR